MLEENYIHRPILVLGGSGFLGRHLIAELKRQDFPYVSYPTHSELNLTYKEGVYDYISSNHFDYIINAAAIQGNMLLNERLPYTLYQENTLIYTNVYEAARTIGVKKLLNIVSSCSYPDLNHALLYEEDYFEGKPHFSVEPIGYSKRNIQVLSKLGRPFPSVCVCPTTLFGPGDSTDLGKCKVLGSIIMKFIRAKRERADYCELYGNGSSLRQYIGVKDAAQLIIKSLFTYDDSCLPLNLATNSDEYTIAELAGKIKRMVGYNGRIAWNITKSNGQYRKALSNEKMKKILGGFVFTPFDDILKETIAYYETTI